VQNKLEWIENAMKQTYDFIFINSATGEGIQAFEGYKSMTAKTSG
jgi:predicted O-methyltransferase YrrM